MKNIYAALSTLMVSAFAFCAQISFAQSESTFIKDVFLQSQGVSASGVHSFVLTGNVLKGSYDCAAKGKAGILDINIQNEELFSIEPAVLVVLPSAVKFCPLEIWQPVFESVETKFQSTLSGLKKITLKNVNQTGNDVSLNTFLN